MGVVTLHVEDFDIGRAIRKTLPFFQFGPRNQGFFWWDLKRSNKLDEYMSESSHLTIKSKEKLAESEDYCENEDQQPANLLRFFLVNVSK